jgi:predicted ArsR family transcriptional regulator
MTVSIPERRYDALSELLAACGYEPSRAADQLVLRPCPFQRLAGNAPELVCALTEDRPFR